MGYVGAGNAFSEDEALCAAGVPIKIEDTPGLMHHKFMAIDAGGVAPKVLTGPLNWTASAKDQNSENMVIVHDGATAQAYAAAFQGMWDGLAVAPCAPELAPVACLPFVHTEQTPMLVVRLTRIVYNPPGDDLAGEQVRLRNAGAGTVALTGWTLRDGAATPNVHTFPAFELAAGATVTVWVKAGTDTGRIYSGGVGARCGTTTAMRRRSETGAGWC